MSSVVARARLLTALAALGCLVVPDANGIGTWGLAPGVGRAGHHHVVLAIDLTFLLAGVGLGTWIGCA